MTKSTPTRLAPETVAAGQKFAENLRMAREARGWSQDELAKRAVMSKPTVSKIELGSVKPSWENVLSILEVLGMAEQIAAIAAPHTDEEGRRLRGLKKARVRKS